MVTFIAFAVVAIAAMVNGFTPDVEHLKNDYLIRAPKNSGHRLAGWQILRPKNVKCDMVRPNIKRFGYCYEDDNAQHNIDTTKERGWVREVLQQWEKCGGIKFVEEAKCRKGPDFVTVKVGAYGPVLFPMMNNTETCQIDSFIMYLNFYTFGDKIEPYRRTEKIRQSEVKMYALHEFGHFLGFDHEQNRADRTDASTCAYQKDKEQVGPNAIWGHYVISTEYDKDSIMNYCRRNVHYKPWLSESDKRAVWKAYGGGNWDECVAATKPWKWVDGDGLYPDILEDIQLELDGITKPPKTTTPLACIDRMPDCEKSKGSCDNETMKYWCPVTCKKC